MRSISNVGLGSRSAWLIGTGLAVALMLMAGAAVPSMAQERLNEISGILRACAADVWRLCPGVLPEHVKPCAGQDGPAFCRLRRLAPRRDGRPAI